MIHEHKGHRERMKVRLERYGAEAMSSYELLEMLLFNSIPVQDTRTTAKNLINAFGSLDGVFNAKPSELTSVEGIGARSAELIAATDAFGRYIRDGGFENRDIILDNYRDLGDYLHANFYSDTEPAVIMLSLDSRMRLIGSDIICRLDYSSGGVKPAAFIVAAIKRQATAVVLAHVHPSGGHFPSEGDRETNKLIVASLEGAGFPVLDHYVIAKHKYVGFMTHMKNAFSDQTVFRNYVIDKNRMLCCEGDAMQDTVAAGSATGEEKRILSDLLAFCDKDPLGISRKLLAEFGNIAHLCEADFSQIMDTAGRRIADIIEIAVSLTSRRVTDGIVFGHKYSKERIEEYLKALYLMKSRETVYALLFDQAGKCLAAERIAEGTVNATSIIPRRLLEVARRYKAVSVVIAHNHPSGVAEPSGDDLCTTTLLLSVARDAGLDITAHYIVAADSAVDIIPLVLSADQK